MLFFSVMNFKIFEIVIFSNYFLLKFYMKVFNLRGEKCQLIVHFNDAKSGRAKRNYKREAKIRLKNQKMRYFDAKLRFSLVISLRSSTFSVIKVDN